MAQFFVSPGEPGIVEGNYKSWAWKWTKDIPNELSMYDMSFFIDEKNDRIFMFWVDGDSDLRFGVYTLEDFTEIFLSNPGYHYPSGGGDSHQTGISPDSVDVKYAIARSLQTYFLFPRYGNGYIFEVWRGNSIGSPLWRHDVRDEDANAYPDIFLISQSGKWILFGTSSTSPPKLFLYKGQTSGSEVIKYRFGGGWFGLPVSGTATACGNLFSTYYLRRATYNNIGEYCEVDLVFRSQIKQFRYRGWDSHVGDGSYKIQYYGEDLQWHDWKTGIPTRGGTYSAWEEVSVVTALKVRFVATAIDSVGTNQPEYLGIMY